MKRIFLLPLSLFMLTVTGSFVPRAQEKSGYAIAKGMFEKTATIRSLIYTMEKLERIDGQMVKQSSFTKMVKDPFQIYVRQLYPKEGTEILYVNGKNNDKALINPNGFPWINLKLNPLDGIMRRDQHHTIFQSGFEHVVSILEFLSEKYKAEIEDLVIYDGIVEVDGRPCFAITFSNPYFKIIDYQIEGNESLSDVAARYRLSAHMILEHNPDISDYQDVSPNQVIKIPNDYSPKMKLFIDQKEMIPIRMVIYDDKGLYEQYDYTQVTVNPKIPSEEFLQDYSGYGF